MAHPPHAHLAVTLPILWFLPHAAIQSPIQDVHGVSLISLAQIHLLSTALSAALSLMALPAVRTLDVRIAVQTSLVWIS